MARTKRFDKESKQVRIHHTVYSMLMQEARSRKRPASEVASNLLEFYLRKQKYEDI